MVTITEEPKKKKLEEMNWKERQYEEIRLASISPNPKLLPIKTAELLVELLDLIGDIKFEIVDRNK